ncbi:hypothetical protein [Terricaulis silvestris]|uniref:DUF1579 domain-containing protein n=1 Tax=Terricaulis silvestris TaxID=2686094 RepID=A0A6I6MN72_9CAUL|nr:hypothetical protein [Terricaulis silvestris]QGZ96790.1 hypothetical protein DSM104635_03652 [Terricaulis silvestris]
MALRNPSARILFVLLVFGWLCVLTPHAVAQSDGARDFDWEIGAWNTHVRVRAPLSEDGAWTEFRGASIVHAFADGRANLVDLNVVNGDRRIEGVSLRLFNPQTQQWSLNFASMRDGQLTSPVYGGFENGRGVFYGQDSVDGRVVLVRFVISDVSANTARFVQSYSADGGVSWIDNWIATDTRH